MELELLHQMGMLRETEYKNRISMYDYYRDCDIFGHEWLSLGKLLHKIQGSMKSNLPKNSDLVNQYEYKQRRYIRVLAKSDADCLLSNGHLCQLWKPIWLEEMPITWYIKRIGKNEFLLISQNILLPPMEHCVRFEKAIFDEERKQTGIVYYEYSIKRFMNRIFAKEIVQSMDYVDYFNYDEVREELEQKQFVKK